MAINQSIIHPGCSDWVAKPYIYLFLEDYGCLYDILDRLHIALISTKVNELCNATLRGYFCNYVFPGCDPGNSTDNSTSDHQPIGICHEDCEKYLLGENCRNEIDFLANLGTSTGEFNFPIQCSNTLNFVADSGLSVNASKEQCTHLNGK